jgi:hypothetical protein
VIVVIEEDRIHVVVHVLRSSDLLGCHRSTLLPDAEGSLPDDVAERDVGELDELALEAVAGALDDWDP